MTHVSEVNTRSFDDINNTVLFVYNRVKMIIRKQETVC